MRLPSWLKEPRFEAERRRREPPGGHRLPRAV
jgi:hypothetical protein